VANEAATSPLVRERACEAAPDRRADDIDRQAARRRRDRDVAGLQDLLAQPGQFGVPPAFDWSGSTNIGGLDVRWPVPERFQDSAAIRSAMSARS
jgi:hypothetical protein